MTKRMIFLGQDPDRAEFYNLYVRATDIPDREVFKEIQDELLGLGFLIFHYDGYTIEARFKNRYMQVSDMRSHLDSIGWQLWHI